MIKAKALMLQGTGSDVGKSVLVAGLCRIARRRGFSVAPFKPQNMSNNAAVCPSGGEIGRAQALQAQAAGLAPHVDFNPILLKPQSDRTSQIVVHGRVHSALNAADYMARRDGLMGPVRESFHRLATRHDLIIVEGAGSPAEVNLRARDIANMGFARAHDVPVCLVGDIDRGGVIAALAGTKAVLDAGDQAQIKAFLINKFRGDPALFVDGLKAIEAYTGWPSMGVLPWLSAPSRLPAEDAVVLERRASLGAVGDRIKIAAPMLSRMANFDDADPLRLDPRVEFHFIPPGRPLPRDCDVILLFGTKSTLGELAFIKAQGWYHDLHAHARQGGVIMGLCGGYQMLGRMIHDPEGLDGEAGSVEGLGLLDVETVMQGPKTVRLAHGVVRGLNRVVEGYEIHSGKTTGPDTTRPFIDLEHGPDGALRADGRIGGTYMHGLFSANGFRSAWLHNLGASSTGGLDYRAGVEAALDSLADEMEAHLDSDALLALAQTPRF